MDDEKANGIGMRPLITFRFIPVVSCANKNTEQKYCKRQT
jgi:hypothetical protein